MLRSKPKKLNALSPALWSSVSTWVHRHGSLFPTSFSASFVIFAGTKLRTPADSASPTAWIPMACAGSLLVPNLRLCYLCKNISQLQNIKLPLKKGKGKKLANIKQNICFGKKKLYFNECDNMALPQCINVIPSTFYCMPMMCYIHCVYDVESALIYYFNGVFWGVFVYVCPREPPTLPQWSTSSSPH